VSKSLQPSRLAALCVIAPLAVVLSACGMSSSGSTTSSTTKTSTPSSQRVSAAAIGSLGSVLTGTNGRTLYYLTTETSSAITCTGACASAWPPLLVPGGATVAHATGVTGTLSTAMRPDGTTQVTYNGHPVYYFSGDTTTGQANGQGVHGTWFVLKSGSAGGGAASTTPTSTGSSGNSYGY
jgi:predicted lipoprotein with Yx(FWY)xxD motif